MDQMFNALITRLDDADANRQIEVAQINCRIDDMFKAVMTKLDGLDNAKIELAERPRWLDAPTAEAHTAETIVASASHVASAYIAEDKLVCAKATPSATFVCQVEQLIS
jgi:hypothetical protein